MFDIDYEYKNSSERILNYFNTNYDAIYKYLKRLEYVHIIYIENENLDKETIKNEIGIYTKWIIYVFPCICQNVKKFSLYRYNKLP